MLHLESEFILLFLSLLLFTKLTRILKTKEVEKSLFLLVFLDLNQIIILPLLFSMVGCLLDLSLTQQGSHFPTYHPVEVFMFKNLKLTGYF